MSLIADNSFTDNASYAMSIPGDVSLGTGNTYSGNGDGIELRGGTFTTDITWSKQSVPYIVTGHVYVYDASEPTLTIEPGVEVRFDGAYHLMLGRSSTSYSYSAVLNAQGTASNPIIFTSNSATPSPGDWYGIQLNNHASTESILEYVTVEYGGYDNTCNICIVHQSATIKNSTIRYSSARGIQIGSAFNSFLTITDSTVSDNGAEGVYTDNSGTPLILLEITGTAVSNNGSSGVYVGNNVSVSSIADNSFTDNASYAMSIPGDVGLGTGNTYSGNGDGIELRGGTFTTDITWSKQSVPYIVTGHVYVYDASEPTLTIEPGVEVRFDGAYFLKLGYSSLTFSYSAVLNAQGTASNPIIFTSNSATPQPGDWYGIQLNNHASTESILEYVTVEYGGYDNTCNICIVHQSAAIKNSTIRYSSAQGINIVSGFNSFLTITDSTISDNAGEGVYVGNNVSVSSIADNSFTNNGSYVMSIPLDVSLGTGNTYSGNGNGIELRGGTLTTDITWSTQSVPYIVTRHIYVNGAVLTIEPGVELRFDGQWGLNIGNFGTAATLKAQGTASNPIVFTSNSAIPQPDDWNGIRFLTYASDDNILEYVTVEYGGNAVVYGANVYIQHSSLTIKNSTIRHSSTAGIYLVSAVNSFLTITDSTVSDNGTEGVRAENSGSLTVGLTITRSSISNNGGYGVYSTVELNVSHSNITENGNGIYSPAGIIADARFNWWGDATGPSGQGPGTGQSVTLGISFEPWLGTTFTYPFYNTNLYEMPQEFSPLNNSADFTYAISEDADWTFSIKGSGGAPVRTFAGSGLEGTVTWDGKDEDSIIVPDGAYTYQLSSTSLSDSSESAPLIGNIVVGEGLPEAEITYPMNGQVVGNSPLNIQGTADDSDFTDYKVEYGYGTGPTTWTLINSSTTAVNDDTLAQWDPSNLTDRYYTIRLSVNDNAGNTAIASIGVKLLFIYNVNVSNPDFSPNGDGVEDTTTISARITYSSDFTVDIKESGGAVIRSFTGTGDSISALWDGKDMSGVIQPQGAYTYTITATEPGSGAISTFTGTITIDLSPPTAITDLAANITAYFAELNATVNPNGLETIVYFEWGTDTSYGNTTSLQSTGSGTGNVPVSADITCLSPITTYHYRVVAVNADWISYGLDEAFTTTEAISAATWCGGGTDGLASNPANWAENMVPQDGDDVIYDRTSTKDCTWDVNVTPASLSLNSGYTGTAALDTSLTVTGSLTIVSGTLDLNGKSLNVDGDLIIGANGTLNAASSIIRVKGSWTNSGSFNPGTSTVILGGTNQTIYGSTTFYNLVKIVASADTLYFEAGSTQTISNSLTFTGAADNLLSLRSTQSGQQWMIDPQGTRSVSFVDVKDSNNIHTTTIVATDSVDSGNNINWSFDGSECVCNENGLILAKIIGDSNGGIHD
ncbi:MAG TPA: hypothetical protein ENH01_08960 [Nitrospirae bacterium]|nr:hypothetical protein [Nitrospirota bacterium]